MSRNIVNGSQSKLILAPLDSNIISAAQDQIVNGRASDSGDVVINGRVADYEIIKLLGGTFVRNSDALYTNPDTGLITTVGSNIPRFESVGGKRAILLEPAGTNLIQYSHELGNVASGGWWADTRLTSVTADGMLAPDGNTVADGSVADVVNAVHGFLSPAIAGIAQNDKVVLTTFAKPGNKDWIRMYVDFYDAGDVSVGDYGSYYFNVASGALGVKTEVGATIHDYMIESAPNGFYRCGLIVSNANAATAKAKALLYSAHADNDSSFPGDAATVNTWFWGADLKKQAFFSSYVPTSGATATRATESGYPLWSLPLGLFDAEGTCVVWVRFGWGETDMPQDGTRTNSGIIVTRNDASSLVFVEHDSDFATNASFSSFDGTAWATKEYNFIANTWYKLVVKWSSITSKMQASVDTGAGTVWGVEAAFDGSYTLGANLRLAYELFGPMWLRDLRLYDRVLTDAEINDLGSPA